MTEYDLAERPLRIEGREGSNHLYTAEVTYDGYGHSSGFREQVGTNRTIYNTAITYDTAGRVTKCSFTNGSVAYTYDGVGRIATKSITAGTYTDTCTYSYLAGGYGTGSTTGLITSQSQGNESCTYGYYAVTGYLHSYKRSADSAAVTYSSISDLDHTEILSKKRSEAPQYWAARLDKKSGFVFASIPLTYALAYNRMMMEGDVLARNKVAALALVGPTGNYDGPEKHNGSKGYYLPHYHARHGMGHVFYFGIIN